VESHSYAVVLEPEQEGGFSVSVPALPEAHTQGETVEECLANAREVIQACLLARQDLGEEIPPSDSGALLAVVTISPAA
jgi:antitoxin HicB